jgi:hypothetical protein
MGIKRSTGHVAHYDNHPFGLSLLEPTDGGPIDIWFFDFTSTMTRLLAAAAVEDSHDDLVTLRVINAQSDKKSPDQHMVFFESHLSRDVFICAGCTDFSGGGNEARQKMENIFACLSQMYDIQVQREEVDLDRYEQFQRQREDHPVQVVSISGRLVCIKPPLGVRLRQGFLLRAFMFGERCRRMTRRF